MSVRFYVCHELALIDLASAGKQARIVSKAPKTTWRFAFHFLEIGRMKDAEGARGKAVAVDREKRTEMETTVTSGLNLT